MAAHTTPFPSDAELAAPRPAGSSHMTVPIRSPSAAVHVAIAVALATKTELVRPRARIPSERWKRAKRRYRLLSRGHRPSRRLRGGTRCLRIASILRDPVAADQLERGLRPLYWELVT